MHRLNLSISNSNRKSILKKIALTIIWIIFFLFLFDAGLQILFRINISQIAEISSFFNYGLSSEAKIRQSFQDKPIPHNSILYAGWLHEDTWKDQPANADIAIYGMSFSNNIAHRLGQICDTLVIRQISGPSAPPSHSYAAYLLDKNQHTAKFVVLAILAGNLKYLLGMTNDTIGWDFTLPCTYPRYFSAEDQLSAVIPYLNSFSELEKAIQTPELWDKHLAQLSEYDNYYNPLLYPQNIFDESIIGRLIRRGLATRQNLMATADIHNRHGFNENHEAIMVLKKIIINFNVDARSENRIPIVLLIHNQGYADHLYQVTQKTLSEHHIPYLSTHDICPATDPRNFISDGHFTAVCDIKIARKLLALMNTLGE